MNIFGYLQRDHREIDRLLGRLEVARGAADFDEVGRRYLLDRLVSVASRHEAAEELAFWPHVRRRLPNGDDLADHALRAEGDAKAVLDLLRITRSEDDIIVNCAELHTLVRAHAGFEEDTVFPALRASTTRIWAAIAGIQFRLARRLGPTRPHPKGPDRPVGLLTRGALSMASDHLRDLRRRSRRSPVGFDDPGGTDAAAVLKNHHFAIEQLMNQIDRQVDPDDKLVQSLIREVSIHDAIERQYLYPAVRQRLPDGDASYHQLVSEHGRIAHLAAQLDVYRYHDDARNTWIHELVVDVRTHIEQEEAAILPALVARMTHEELVDLGDLLETARTKAPTRPHPHVAGSGTGAKLTRLAAKPIDKARDALTGRRT